MATLGRAHGETAVAGQHGHLWCYTEEMVWGSGVYAGTEGIRGGGTGPCLWSKCVFMSGKRLEINTEPIVIDKSRNHLLPLPSQG